MELDYKEIGRNIRFYRKRRGLTQKQLAALVHVSAEHICHIENAHTKLSLATTVAIANALGVDCNTLLGDTLVSARGAILNQRLHELVSKMGASKLELVVEFCRTLEKFDVSKS